MPPTMHATTNSFLASTKSVFREMIFSRTLPAVGAIWLVAAATFDTSAGAAGLDGLAPRASESKSQTESPKEHQEAHRFALILDLR